MNARRRNWLNMIVAFVSHLLVNCAQMYAAPYPVTLIFPPARYTGRNSLESSKPQQSCQGQYKALGPLTHLQPGSKVNVAWLQMFPLKTVYRIDLRDNNENAVARLKHADLNNSKQTFTKHQMIQLPSNFTCVTCTLRLDVWPDAPPHLKPTVFSSCADVQISTLASLQGEATLHVQNDCWNSSDCSENGICSDIGTLTSLHGQCFCNSGWFGKYCENESFLKDFNEKSISDYIHTNLSDQFQLYHRIEQDKREIEFVLRVTESPLVGIGWRQSGSQCQVLSPRGSNYHFRTHFKNLAKASDLLTPGNAVDVAKAGVPVKGLVSRYQTKLVSHIPRPHSFGEEDGGLTSKFRGIPSPESSTPKFDLWDASTALLRTNPYEDLMMANYRQQFWRKHVDDDNFQEMEESPFNLPMHRSYFPEGKLKLNDIVLSNPAYLHHRFDRSTRRLNKMSSAQAEENNNLKIENETPAPRIQSVMVNSSLNRLNPGATATEKKTPRISSKMSSFDGRVSLQNTQHLTQPGDRNFDSKVENMHPVHCTDLLIGSVLGPRLHIAQCSMTDQQPPQLDCSKSKIENILTAAYGFETNGTTTVVFRKKLSAFKAGVLGIPDETMDVIWITGHKKPRIHSLSAGLLSNALYGKYQLEIRGNRAINFYADGHKNAGRRQPLSQNVCPMIWQSCFQEFSCGFHVVWVVNTDRKEIRFIFSSNLYSMAFKWIGIGFSKDAELAHSDMLIVWVGVNGRPTVLDSHLSENGIPEIKESQDIFDLYADVDNDDKLIVKFTRKLTTGDDTHDFSFASDSSCAHLFYTYGGVSWDGQSIGHPVEQVFTPHKVCLSSCPGLFQKFYLSMKIDNLQWDASLRNNKNKRYCELKEDIEDLLDDIFDDIDGFDSVDIIGFRNGSIIVDFVLKLTIPVLRPHDMSSKMNILQELTNQVNSTFNSLVASGNLGLKYILDKSYRKMTQLHEGGSSLAVEQHLRTVHIGIGVAVVLTTSVLLISLYKYASSRLKTKKHVTERSFSEQNVWSIDIRNFSNNSSRQEQETEIFLTDMLNISSSTRTRRDPIADVGKTTESVFITTKK